MQMPGVSGYVADKQAGGSTGVAAAGLPSPVGLSARGASLIRIPTAAPSQRTSTPVPPKGCRTVTPAPAPSHPCLRNEHSA